MAESADDHKEIVHRFFDGYNERDSEQVRSTLSEDFVHYNHPAAESVDNRVYGDLDDIDTYLEVEFAYFEAFPDLEYTIEMLIVEGDMLACRWTTKATYEPPNETRPGSSESSQDAIAFSGLNLIRIRNGTIAEIWGSHDDLGLYARLGLIDAPTLWV